MSQKSITYCRECVRTSDYDRYLLSLFAPAKVRDALWVLYAFNYEIAKTRDVVSETTIGLIRLQWWRDAIREIYNGATPRRHEVVEPLAEIIQKYDLPQKLFEDLIYAREFDLEGVAPTTIDGLINYCDFTTTPLTALALKIMEEEESAEDIKAVSVHYALIGTLRAVPYMLGERRIMLPQDILAKYDMREQEIFDFNKVDNLPQVISKVLAVSKPFRYGKKDINSKHLKAMMVVATLYLDKIESVQYDVLSPKMALRPKFFALRVWFKTLF